MKQILFISTTNLHVRNGGALATLGYYNAFRFLYGDRIELVLPEEYCFGSYSNAISVPHRKKWVAYLRSLRGHFHRYRDFFMSFLPQNYSRYELVVINGGFYAGDMVKMFQSYGIRVIVIHHNYEPEYHMDNKTLPTLKGRTSYFVERNERNAYRNADYNIFLTQEDIALHESHYGKGKHRSFLLGVFEPESHSFFPGERVKQDKPDPRNIVITGSMDTVQSIRGIENFRSEYYPIIKNGFSDWKIIIAGRNPDKRIIQFANDNSDCVLLIPNPNDINEIIAKGSIFLCPTYVGGGLKLRLMDGLRNGLPILVHKVSARGYDIFLGQPFVQIYDNQESFLRGITNLVNFIQNNKNYHQKVCAIYRSFFSFEAGCMRLRSIMEEIENGR